MKPNIFAMKNMFKHLLLIFLGFAFLLFSGCEDDDDPVVIPTRNLVQLAQTSGYNILAAALQAADLDDDLVGSGPFTVFAPTDEAFQAAGITASNVAAVEDLEEILLYHVISGNVPSTALSTGSQTTLLGQSITIDANNLTITDAQGGTVNISNPFDVEATNGILHTINGVLLPIPSKDNIYEIASSNDEFEILTAAIDAAGLQTTLIADGPFTVFAPTDAAFEAAGITIDNVAGTPGLAEILSYHLIADSVVSADLQTGEVATVNGQSVSIDASVPSVNGNAIVEPFDVDAANGVVHAIEAVLIPELDLVTTAQLNGYSVLAAGLEAADLVNTLQDDMNEYTVFAPTDSVFEANGITAANIGDLDNLEQILLNHVLPSRVTSDMLADGMEEALSGKLLTIDATNLTINDVAIAAPFDVNATNGVIHTINGLLLPLPNVVELASDEAALSVLVAALTKFPDLVETLSDESGMYTVLAPTDDAFVELLATIGQSELDDIPENVLRRILEYHVVSGTVADSASFTQGQMVETVLGDDIEVTSTANGLTLNGTVDVIGADNEVSNGIVHVVDAVLVPPLELSIVNTIVEPAYFNVNFTTLTQAVVDAGLLNTLIDPNINYTLFAPTNAAFDSAGITDLSAFTTEELQGVLQYHVIGSEITAEELPVTTGAFAEAVTTLNGDFYLTNNATFTAINGNSNITAVDIAADNGIVHVIDRTLVPASANIVEIAQSAGYTRLAEALTEAGLVGTLEGAGPFTVFAPTNEAFDALYAALSVSGPADIQDAVLEDVLLYHVISGVRVFSTDLTNGLVATTLSDAQDPDDTNITISITDDGVSLGDYDPDFTDPNVTQTNVLGTNGVIHEIDNILVPVDLP